jgi:hypothetical protein
MLQGSQIKKHIQSQQKGPKFEIKSHQRLQYSRSRQFRHEASFYDVALCKAVAAVDSLRHRQASPLEAGARPLRHQLATVAAAVAATAAVLAPAAAFATSEELFTRNCAGESGKVIQCMHGMCPWKPNLQQRQS